MRAVVWITERTWEACVDETIAFVPADADLTLLAVPDADAEAVAPGCSAAGRRRRPPLRRRRRGPRAA